MQTYGIAVVRTYDLAVLNLPNMTLVQAEETASRLNKLSPTTRIVVVNKESI